MVTDRYQRIEKLTENNPNRIRESYFRNNDSVLYDDIMSFTKEIDIKFNQRIWHWVNNFPEEFLCVCGKKISFHRNWRDGYRTACSAKCAQNKLGVKLKRKKTTLQKWGVDNVSKSNVVKDRMYKTNLEKWGSKSSFQNIEVRNKWKNSMNAKYGTDHYFKTTEFKEKCKNYYLKKWGVTHQLQVEEIKEKIKSTCQFRYGVDTYLNTEHSRSNIKLSNRSKYEDEVINFIEEYGFSVESNKFSIISPLSLDIYVPEKNLAIEFNGLYWHSEEFKDKNYHLNKTKRSVDIGIHLIHIWEDDWLNRKEVIKSIIRNRLGVINLSIPARKCLIKECSNKESSEFLNDNHIQGYNKFSKSYGLVYREELVSIMTFGWRSINGKREYELIRFCNKINTNVVGGASKLFKYFLNQNTDIDIIHSYADVSMFSGSVYNKLGFKLSHRSSVNYWWVVDGVRRHRFSFNKKKLVKMGHSPLKTEVEIMNSLGNYRIWGCGQDKWVWTR